MDAYGSIEPRAQVYEPRRLTVMELEEYIRPGCACSVCDLARTEIALLRREASGPRPPVGECSRLRDVPLVGVGTPASLGLFIGWIRTALTSWRTGLESRWRRTITGPSRKS